MADLFSDGVDRLLNDIRPYGQQNSFFPRDLKGKDVRRKRGDSLQDWFKRVVRECQDTDCTKAALEENIAVFLEVRWTRQKRLTYVNIQTVVVLGSLLDYYRGASFEAQYLRLDYDEKSLGGLFSHPLAHVHLEGELSPRFSLDGGDSGNVIVDYLEFLYRHYEHTKWLKWAERQWKSEFLSRFDGQNDADPWPSIQEAYQNGELEFLRANSLWLERIKEVLRQRKDAGFTGHMQGSDRVILEYPAAR